MLLGLIVRLDNCLLFFLVKLHLRPLARIDGVSQVAKGLLLQSLDNQPGLNRSYIVLTVLIELRIWNFFTCEFSHLDCLSFVKVHLVSDLSHCGGMWWLQCHTGDKTSTGVILLSLNELFCFCGIFHIIIFGAWKLNFGILKMVVLNDSFLGMILTLFSHLSR